MSLLETVRNFSRCHQRLSKYLKPAKISILQEAHNVVTARPPRVRAGRNETVDWFAWEARRPERLEQQTMDQRNHDGSEG